MKLRVSAAIAILLLAGACSESKTADPESTPSASASATESPAAEEFVIAPGRIGSVLVGMTVEEANQTGYFEPWKKVADDPCADTNPPIQWKAPNTETHTVRVKDDKISSLGVREGTKTGKGIGVGSTYAEVTAAYSGAKAEASQALGSTVYIQDGEKWLGLGFDEEPGEIKDGSKVLYMEVSLGSKPATFLSGCP